ncbi:MAG TPA: GNAT family N-acetyltransferase [Acidimicrobiales bacterium]|nr:GNAT family N-acetyltransferase [Acidimicrobiales bacterium]
MGVIIERGAASSEALRALFDEALAALVHKRGGRALLDSLSATPPSLDAYLAEEVLWIAREEKLVGLGVCRGPLILGLYVAPAVRRRGVARALVNEMIRVCSPNDAYALPGDRAMKSLYESLGWKARLLTMRAE